MASLETIQAMLERMEREQKVRDDGLRRAFHLYADTVERLRQTIDSMMDATKLPMDMGEFITLMTTMLNRQRQLLESIGEEVEDRIPPEQPDERIQIFADENEAGHAA